MRKGFVLVALVLLVASFAACESGKNVAGTAKSRSVATTTTGSASASNPRESRALHGPHGLRSDDAEIGNYGQAPSATDRRAIVALTTRYLRAARAADGRRACSLIYSLFAEAIPEDYGRGAGPAYSRGDTCPVVMTKIFRRDRAQLSGRFVVTDVRVRGQQARALVGSATAPAGYLQLRRERHVWKVDALLTQPLP